MVENLFAVIFRCLGQFVAMMFCQLAQAKSLREIVDGLACCEGKLRHLGLENGPRRSTLCYANAHRPWQLYEGVFHDLLNLARSLAPGKGFGLTSTLALSRSRTLSSAFLFFVDNWHIKPES